MSRASLSLLDLAGVKPYQMKKDEEYMNEEQILHFRKILNAWHEQIVEEASRTVAHMQDEVTNFPDPADRATQEEEFSLELRNRDRERKLMKKIEATLKNLIPMILVTAIVVAKSVSAVWKPAQQQIFALIAKR